MLMSAIFFLASCGDDKKEEEKKDDPKMGESNESKEEKNKAIALESEKAYNAGNIDEALKYAAPDAVDYGNGSMPPVRGVDSIRAMLHGWRDNLEDFKDENVWAMADGDNVALFYEYHAKFKGDVMGMKTAGKTVHIKDVDIFKFNNDGKIIEHRSLQSNAELMNQLNNSK
jgi:predicted ester cyclase